MNSRVLILMAALLLAMLALSGCSTDNNEHQRLVAEADLVNAGAPVTVAFQNDNGTAGDFSDDFTPIEFVSVLFTVRPLNSTMVIPEDGTYSTFNVTHYDLVWSSNDPTVPLSDYNVSRGNITVTIPVDDEVVAAVLVGNLAMKTETWFPGNGGTPFTAELEIIFYGHESSSEHEVAVRAGTTVQFLGLISES